MKDMQPHPHSHQTLGAVQLPDGIQVSHGGDRAQARVAKKTNLPCVQLGDYLPGVLSAQPTLEVGDAEVLA